MSVSLAAGLKQGLILLICCLFCFPLAAQDFMLQGWYWDYDKNNCNDYNGPSWANRLNGDVQALETAGFTYVWLPPLSRASFGACSNGYDPQDLYDLGGYGQGPTGFGTTAELGTLLATMSGSGIKAVADVVYNHRDGGRAEDNPAVKDYIEEHFTTGKSPFPSDRFRCRLPLGGDYGAGKYYFKISSKTQSYGSSTYKFYAWVAGASAPYLGSVNESEPNGGGDCGQPNDTVRLNQDMVATLYDFSGCYTDEFFLELTAADFAAAGDDLLIELRNNGGYSDHRIYSIYYEPESGGPDRTIDLTDLRYETFTDYTQMPSNQGGMTFENFRPNTANTATTFLSGDYDYPWFFSDVVQAESSTATVYNDWTWWLHDSVGIEGLRMDAIKHFPPSFVSQLLDDMNNRGWDPGMVVGEFFDTNPNALANWVNQVNAGVSNSTAKVRIFDFSLRSALKEACDNGNYDKRNVFNSSIRDATALDGFSVVTFLNNHDYRDAGQPVQNDALLGYVYLLTNNQLGVPTVFYPDFFATPIPHAPTVDIQAELGELMQIHRDHIFESPQVEYLNNFGSSRAANYQIGGPGQGLIYQLNGGVGSETVIVAINFGYGTLKVDQQIGLSTNVNPGAQFTDLTGNAFQPVVTVDNAERLLIDIPARSYGIYVLSAAALPVTLSTFTAKAGEDGLVTLDWASSLEENLRSYRLEYSENRGRTFRPVTELSARNRPATYTYHHQAPWPGNHRVYRLRMLEMDGKETFSPLREVSYAKGEPIDIYPNPARDRVLIRGAKAEDRWTLYSALGRPVAVPQHRRVDGWEMLIDGVAPGIYFLRDQHGQARKLLIRP